MALTKLEKAQAALDKAETAERETIAKTQIDSVNKTSAERGTAAKEAEAARLAKQNTLEGDLGDSKRVLVTVERKYDTSKARVYAATVINKNGKPKLESFKIPVNTPVELPVEIIAMLKDRGIPRYEQVEVPGKPPVSVLALVKEFAVYPA